MIRLPKWVLTNPRPSVYDSESATAIEMVAKLYQAMNETIEDYNKFVDTLTQRIDKYTEETDGNIETFKISLRQEFQDFIDVIELKMRDAETYMKTNLQETANRYLREIISQLNNDMETFANDRAYFRDEFEKQTKAIASQNTTLASGIKYMEQSINEQNTQVANAVTYMETNLNETITNKVEEMIVNGDIVMGVAYDETTEDMSIVARNITMPTDLALKYNEETETIEIVEI